VGHGEVPLRFDRDGGQLYVQSTKKAPSSIVRVDVRSGQRAPWLELAPLDAAGVFTVDRVHLSEDGRSYVYSCRRLTSRLALIAGVL
jgi:hypothetical protein